MTAQITLDNIKIMIIGKPQDEVRQWLHENYRVGNIRVYPEGAFLTQDYWANRINAEYDRETQLVKEVWYG